LDCVAIKILAVAIISGIIEEEVMLSHTAIFHICFKVKDSSYYLPVIKLFSNVQGLVEFHCSFLGKVMASSSGSSGQPRKIILLRRNVDSNVQCGVVREAVRYVYLEGF
jgi:hypothetical protein